MQDKISELIDSLKSKWQELEKQQKMRLILGILVLIIALGVTLYFAFRPKWTVLYGNKDYTTLNKIQTVLNDAGIEYKLMDNDTSIAVLEKNKFTAMSAVDADPEVAGAAGFGNQEYFDQAGFGVSQTVMKDMSRIAKQTEIAEGIKQLYAVTDATVILNVPDSNGFIFKEIDKSTASVIIKQNSTIDAAKVQAIVDYVEGAVQGLDKENIKVINQHMEVLYSGGSGGITSLNTDYEIELLRKSEIETKLYYSLVPIFDEAKIISNVVVNTNRVQEEKLEVFPVSDDVFTGVVSQESTLKENATSSGTGAEVGLGANDQATSEYQTGDNSGESSANRTQQSKTYETSKTTTYTEYSYGDLITEQSAVSIIGYRYKVYDQKYMEENKLLGDLTWVQFKEEKQGLAPFRIDIESEGGLNYQGALTENLKTGIGIDRISLIAYELYYFVDAEPASLDWQLIVVFAILVLLIAMLAVGLLRKAEPEEILEVDPELSVEDLLVSTQLEEEKEEQVEKLRDIDYTADSEVKKQISKFVEDKPEAVAQLLRNWLNEGWE